MDHWLSSIKFTLSYVLVTGAPYSYFSSSDCSGPFSTATEVLGCRGYSVKNGFERYYVGISCRGESSPAPTVAPTGPSREPSKRPSRHPTWSRTRRPTVIPSAQPTPWATATPTSTLSFVPTPGDGSSTFTLCAGEDRTTTLSPPRLPVSMQC